MLESEVADGSKATGKEGGLYRSGVGLGGMFLFGTIFVNDMT